MLNHNNGVSAAVANQHQGTSSPLQFPNSPNPNFSSNQPGGPSLVSSSIEALMRSKFELLDQVKHTMHGVSHAIPGKNIFFWNWSEFLTAYFHEIPNFPIPNADFS